MTFFKTLRRRLISRNDTAKYLKYALGEIILVVIGILIAMQINNWNQNRLNRKTEIIYLEGLKEEFEISKLKLEALITVNQKNYSASKRILEYINSETNLPSEASFSELLYTSFSTDIAFNPNNSLLFEMINSGNLKNLSNPQLRKQLTNWISTLTDISKQEEELGLQRIEVIDMFRTDENSLKTIFKQAGVYNTLDLPEDSKSLSNLSLLQSTAFENNILMFILASYATEQAHYIPLMSDLNTILELIDKELKT
ncbi:hypothetical protein I3217_04385 [Formosa sp. S-31]